MNVVYPLRLLHAFVGLGGLLMASAGQAQVMNVEIQPLWGTTTLEEHAQQTERTYSGLKVERVDFLLSALALKQADGSWLESEDWTAFFSWGKGRLVAQADGLPAEKFTAIRFDVGLPPNEDAADPASRAPGHPLHPDICGLHWGWQEGYVFMALEGRWPEFDARKQWGGFSYHLARQTCRTRIEIPVDFQGGGPLTLRIGLDLSQVLGQVDPRRDGTSTHSRDGDPLASRLVKGLAHAFRLRSVHYDTFHPTASVAKTASPVLPAATRSYELDISSRFPQVKLPVDNPLTQEGVALGKKLFHDPRLSFNNSQSCASCHDRRTGFSDARKVSIGAAGREGKRQTMPLFNLAWHQAMFWDGRAASLREQVLMPIQDPHEMNEELENVPEKIVHLSPDFEAAFGSPGITAERTALALEQYLLTLVSQDSRFDRAARRTATLTEEEKRGLQLFVTEFDPGRGLRGADCFHCHGSTLFTDHQFKNNGLDLADDDVGLMAVTGKLADRGKFKTPSLRNVAATAPYMHDGRFSTLEEVVEHYSDGVKRTDQLDPNLAKHPASGMQLTEEEKRALVAFLKTLTDESFLSSSDSQQPPLAQTSR